ncbi:pyridoxamine 5'-phosphate oxidase family protein [Pseudonocardia sichuanensis]
MLPGLDDSHSIHAEERLRGERELWLTTVRSDGQPQSSLVGFLWNGGEVLIMSRPGSQKVRNLTGNPRLALHLEVDRSDDAGGVLTVEGVATPAPGPLGADEAAAYTAKYDDVLQDAGLSAEEFLAEYSAVIRARPTRVRTQ